MTNCRYCAAAVPCLGDHYGGHNCPPCPSVAGAFDGRDKTDPVRSAAQTAARMNGPVGTMRANGPCYRCGKGPRVPGLSYCRPCSRAVHDASQKRIRARQAEIRRGPNER